MFGIFLKNHFKSNYILFLRIEVFVFYIKVGRTLASSKVWDSFEKILEFMLGLEVREKEKAEAHKNQYDSA